MNARHPKQTVSAALTALAALSLTAAHPQAAHAQTIPVGNSNFAIPSAGPNGYQYQPSDPNEVWSFAGGTGVASNSGPFHATSPTPNGDQFAFLQGASGAVSQSLSGFTPGASYALTFLTATRADQDQVLQASVGGQDIGTFRRPTQSGFVSKTINFMATASTESLAFTGLGDGNSTDDVSGLITDVSISQLAAGQSVINIGNNSFEAPPLRAGAYQYNPGPSGPGVDWTFGPSTGIASNGSAFTNGNPPAPDGNQVALIQGANSFSQTLSGFASGTNYTLSFATAGRAGSVAENITASLDGTVLETYTETGTGYTNITVPFTTTAGSHTLTFAGLGVPGQDVTAFFDNVQITGIAAAPEPSAWAGLTLGALGLGGLALKARRRQAVIA